MSTAEAREQALAALYEADQRRMAPVTSHLRQRERDIVDGVWTERDELDAVIGGASTSWRVERMPPVDRNVLRIATWELRHRDRTPIAVVISEAVRLVRTYSTERSAGFVNGVLARIAELERAEP